VPPQRYHKKSIMPLALEEIQFSPSPTQPPRKRWARPEYAALESLGLLDQERLELVEGELISKMGKKRPHSNSLGLLQLWMQEIFGGRFVSTETPIDVAPLDNPRNEPEPDLIVLKEDFTTFRSSNPKPADLHLVVEIADTTLAFDLKVKAALYARAAIPEYWVLDITGRRLIVHRDPQAGTYQSVVAYAEDESVSPLSAPTAALRVRDAFPE
jgi:Uma2 family endonuclease